VKAIGNERTSAPTTADAGRMSLTAMLAAWGPVALWMAVIFSLSSDQFSEANTAAWIAAIPLIGAFGPSPAHIAAGNLIVRKCAHFVEYAILSMLTYRALRASRPRLGARWLMTLAVVFSGTYASLDELHQWLGTRSRTGSPMDVLLDTVGALAGAAVGATYLYRHTQRSAA
jgi:VanZ family protein